MTELAPPDGVVYEDHLPLSVETASVPGGSEAERLLGSTLHVLEAVNAIEEPIPERRDDVSWHPDLVRLDRRVNLIVEMVARLLARDVDAPQAVDVMLYSDGIAWRPGGDSPAAPAGTEVICRAYLPVFPALPIALPAISGGDLGSRHGWVYARFSGLGEAASEQLDRLIFRRHRRVVAGQRGGGE